MMTPRQKQLFDFVEREIDRCGRSPSYGEIAEHLGMRSQSAVAGLVVCLEGRGFLVRVGGRRNGQLRIVRLPTRSHVEMIRRRYYASFRFDDDLKCLVEYRDFITAA
jgi:SOS-response transcriptional repressor LexA